MIIAEVGLNHCGDYNAAKLYVEELIATTVDAITFQIREDEFYKDHFKNYKLSIENYKNLKKIIKDSGKKFGLAISSKNFYNYPTPDIVKVLSKDFHDAEFINEITTKWSGKKYYLSTGLSTYKEIDNTLNLLKDKKNVYLIHTSLSNGVDDVNLSAIQKMKNKYGDIICFGNHCEDETAIYLASAYKPKAYFFYVKDKNGLPDDLHAIKILNIRDICDKIKTSERIIGCEVKEISSNKIEGQS